MEAGTFSHCNVVGLGGSGEQLATSRKAGGVQASCPPTFHPARRSLGVDPSSVLSHMPEETWTQMFTAGILYYEKKFK